MKMEMTISTNLGQISVKANPSVPDGLIEWENAALIKHRGPASIEDAIHSRVLEWLVESRIGHMTCNLSQSDFADFTNYMTGFLAQQEPSMTVWQKVTKWTKYFFGNGTGA